MNILMTGGGAPGAAGIIRCLRQDKTLKIIALDMRDDVVGKKMADKFFQVPAAKQESEFVDSIKSLIVKEKIDVVLPLVTRELFIFSKHKSDLESLGAKILVSNYDQLNIANDKLALIEHLKKNKVPVPDFAAAENTTEFFKAIDQLGYPKKPVCFKPAISNGSRGFRILNTAIEEFDLLLNEKPNSVYISMPQLQNTLKGREIPQMIVMEHLPGEEYSVDCLLDNGQIKGIIPRVRAKTSGGISVEGQFIENKEVIAYCEAILGTLKLHGNIGIQVKMNSSNQPRILEINPRVQGTISSALGIGINLPLLAVRIASGESVPSIDNKKIPWGCKFVRYWEELFFTP